MYCNFGKSVYLHYTSYSTYLIYRGHSYNTLQYIDEMPAGGNTSYTDNNAPGGTVYYQIVVILTPDAKDDSQGIIRSNIATDEDEVGIGDVSDNYCNIYQHSGNIVVETPHSHKVQVYDGPSTSRHIYFRLRCLQCSCVGSVHCESPGSCFL